jgi:hypothetical protein
LLSPSPALGIPGPVSFGTNTLIKTIRIAALILLACLPALAQTDTNGFEGQINSILYANAIGKWTVPRAMLVSSHGPTRKPAQSRVAASVFQPSPERADQDRRRQPGAERNRYRSNRQGHSTELLDHDFTRISSALQLLSCFRECWTE